MNTDILLMVFLFYAIGGGLTMTEIFQQYIAEQKSKGRTPLYINTRVVLGILFWPVVFIRNSYKTFKDKPW